MAHGSTTSGDELIALSVGDSSARIAPGIGANGVAFEIDGQAIIEPVPSLDGLRAAPTHGGCPILFPFAGRVRDGRYRFDGRDYQLSLNAPGERAHIHGFAPGARWRVASQDDTSCVCVFDQTMLAPDERSGYPWPFALTVRWSLTPGRLRADVRVENTGEGDLPFAFGLHPYFAVAPDAAVRVPAAAQWPIAAGFMAGPTEATAGAWRWDELEPGASLLLTDLPHGTVEATAGDTVVRFPGDRFGEVVVYRPPAGRAAICIEPWTSVAGAANLLAPGEPHGLLRLAPGTVWEAWVEISRQSSVVSRR